MNDKEDPPEILSNGRSFEGTETNLSNNSYNNSYNNNNNNNNNTRPRGVRFEDNQESDDRSPLNSRISKQDSSDGLSYDEEDYIIEEDHKFVEDTNSSRYTGNIDSRSPSSPNLMANEATEDDRKYMRENSRMLVRHLTRRSILMDSDAKGDDDMSPALKRRLRDFRFAQKKRREKYGEHTPWGIIGLYDHLSGIRTDIEWAEDAAWRRENDQPYLSWQDFEDAKDTGYNQPFFTYFIMLVCTVCLIVSIGLNGWTIEPLTQNPMIGPSAQVLIQMGAKQTSLIVNDGEWYRVFTPMFLHAGIIHYIINMLALWFIGSAVEQSHGFFAAALLFILPAVGGTLFSALFLPEYISVGASGGIFGLIGACLADIISNWGLLFSKVVNNKEGRRFRHIKVLIWLVLDIILNIVIGLTPFVDNFTHMGGMLYGFLCGLSTMERLSKAFFGVQTKFVSRLQTALIRFSGIIFSVIFIITSFIVLASLKNGDQIRCRGCRYISCVPFPFWETRNKWWYCDDCNKPMVEAELYKAQDGSGYFTHLELTCPDLTTTTIQIEEETDDRNYFRSKLASYCREECDNIFAI